MGIGDSGISSLGNLATNILAARILLPDQFGLFSITLLIGIILVGVSRALCGDPLTLLYSAAEPSERRAAFADVAGAGILGTVAAFPLVAAVVTLVMVASRGTWSSGASLGLALASVMPALVGQELMRAVSYARGQSWTAFANSATWTVLLVVALLVVRPHRAPVFILLWGLTALGGVAVGLVLNHVRPRATIPGTWFRRSRHLSRKLLADFGLTQVTAEGSLVLISLVAGAAEAGLVRKGQIPLTPVIVLTNGLIAMAQPALVRQVGAGRTLAQVRRAAYRLGLAALAGSMGLGLLVSVIPTRWMVELVGDQWPLARPLVLVLSLYLGLGAFSGAVGIALRAVGRLGAQLRARAFLTPISLALVFLGAFGGARWATMGLCASLICVTLTWVVLIQRPDDPAAEPGAN